MSASENLYKYFLEKRKKFETFFNLKFNLGSTRVDPNLIFYRVY